MTDSHDKLVEGWIIHSEAFAKAHAVDQFARYAPDVGWRAILAVLALPNALRHMSEVSRALEMLISKFGDLYIRQIVEEATSNALFKECLADITPNPTFPIPRHLWRVLSEAAGVSIGPMSSRMAALYDKIPDLAHLSTVDISPPEPSETPQVSDSDLVGHAQAFLRYHDSFWAWEELERLVRKDPNAAWRVICAIVARGSNDVLCSLGAGALEDLIEGHPADMLDKVEALAAVDSRFRFCLSHVWRGSIPSHIWDRVVAARGDEPQRG